MPYQERIYDNLPIFVRYVDEDKKLLEHVCDSLQPNFDLVRQQILNQEFLYDPSLTPIDFLDWLGQFVGLSTIGSQYLGFGLKPDWPAAHKREVIARAWEYWQRKGTEWGVREAIALWLQWEEAKTERLRIRLPFGKTPTAHPPNWWAFDTPFGAQFNQIYEERQHLGSGDALGGRYQPHWFTLQSPEWKWDYLEVWSDHTLAQVPSPEITDQASHLGPQRPWMHFLLEEPQWNKVFNDIYTLNEEAWNAHSIQTVFGWLEQLSLNPLILDREQSNPQYKLVQSFDIDGFHFGDFWPYPSAPPSDRTETYEETVEFQVWKGCQWGDWWGGVGGRVIADVDRIHTVVATTEGVWLPAQWNDWFSASTPQVVQELTPYNSNLDSRADWGDLWGDSDLWAYQPGGAPKTTVFPNHRFGSPLFYRPAVTTITQVVDPGIPSIVPPYPGVQFYAALQQVTLTKSRLVHDVGSPCVPGFLATIESGFDETWIPGTLAVPASQLLAFVPGHTEEIQTSAAFDGIYTGCRWNDWWLSVSEPAYDLEITLSDGSIDLSGLLPSIAPGTVELRSLPIETLTIIQMLTAVDLSTLNAVPALTLLLGDLVFASMPEIETLRGLVIALDFVPIETLTIAALINSGLLIRKQENQLAVTAYDEFYAPPRAATFTTQTTPASWALAAPVNVSDFYSPFTQSYPWYFKGSPETPGQLERRPRTMQVRLCNVVDQFTRRQIINFKETKVLLQEEDHDLFYFYPLLAKASQAQNWQLLLESDEEIYVLNPTTMFWTTVEDGPGEPANRSQTVSLDNGLHNLYLEFIVQPKVNTNLLTASLLLGDQVLNFQTFYEPLHADAQGCYGFKFLFPFRFATGAGTLADSIAIEEVLFPQLYRQSFQLRHAHFDFNQRDNTPYTIPPIPPINMTTLKQLLENVTGSVEVLLGEADLLSRMRLTGDLSYEHRQVIPVTTVVIEHGLPKDPVVTLQDDAGREFNASVKHSPGAVEINLSEPKTFTVFFN